MSISVKTDGKDLALLEASGRRVRQALKPNHERLGQIYRDALRETVTKKTGRLANSFETAGVSDEGGSVVSDQPYVNKQDDRTGFIDRAVGLADPQVQNETDNAIAQAIAKAEGDAR